MLWFTCLVIRNTLLPLVVFVYSFVALVCSLIVLLCPIVVLVCLLVVLIVLSVGLFITDHIRLTYFVSVFIFLKVSLPAFTIPDLINLILHDYLIKLFNMMFYMMFYTQGNRIISYLKPMLPSCRNNLFDLYDKSMGFYIIVKLSTKQPYIILCVNISNVPSLVWRKCCLLCKTR